MTWTERENFKYVKNEGFFVIFFSRVQEKLKSMTGSAVIRTCVSNLLILGQGGKFHQLSWVVYQFLGYIQLVVLNESVLSSVREGEERR